jgi:hypothetical protein
LDSSWRRVLTCSHILFLPSLFRIFSFFNIPFYCISPFSLSAARHLSMSPILYCIDVYNWRNAQRYCVFTSLIWSFFFLISMMTRSRGRL